MNRATKEEEKMNQTNHATQTKPEYVRAKELCKVLGIARSTLHTWVHRFPNFPKGRRITGRCTIYRMTEVEAFVEGFNQPQTQAGEA